MPQLQNRINAPVTGFQTLLGDVAAYQTFLGVGDPASAIAKTHINRALDDGSQPRPRGIIDLVRYQAEKRTNLAWHFDEDNELYLALEWAGNHGDWATFAGHVNDIHDGVFAIAGTSGYLNLTDVRSEIPWQLNDPDHEGGTSYWAHESFWRFEG